MPRNKKPFISKNKAETFIIAHRSQRDPQSYDENASKYVLVSKKNRRTVGVSGDGTIESIALNEMRRAEAATDKPRLDGKAVAVIDELGFPLDGYDYTQHLREMDGGTFISASGDIDRSNAHVQAVAGRRRIQLPKEVMPDGKEIDRDDMLESITLTGESFPDDVKRALDGEWQTTMADDAAAAAATKEEQEIEEVEDGFEELNDDFIMHATGQKEIPKEWLNESKKDVFNVSQHDDDTQEEAEHSIGPDGFDYDAHIAKLMAKAMQRDAQTFGPGFKADANGNGIREELDEDDLSEESFDSEFDELSDTDDQQDNAEEKHVLEHHLDAILAQYDDMHIGEGILPNENDTSSEHSDEESVKSDSKDEHIVDQEKTDESVQKRSDFRIGEYVEGYGRLVASGLGAMYTDDDDANNEQAALQEAMEDFGADRVSGQDIWESGQQSIRELRQMKLSTQDDTLKEETQENKTKSEDQSQYTIPYGFAEEDYTAERAKAEEKQFEDILLRRKPAPKWDVATIVSTYSNLDNHPAVLRTDRRRVDRSTKKPLTTFDEIDSSENESENKDTVQKPTTSGGFAVRLPPKLNENQEESEEPQFVLSSKSGMPLIQKNDEKRAVSILDHQTSQHDHAVETNETTDSDTSDVLEYVIPARDRTEDHNDKKSRKALAKAQRRARREQKKQTKLAFKTEKQRLQSANAANRSGAASAPAGVSVFSV